MVYRENWGEKSDAKGGRGCGDRDGMVSHLLVWCGVVGVQVEVNVICWTGYKKGVNRGYGSLLMLYELVIIFILLLIT